MSDGPIRVYLEITPKRTFAGALDWPGWCRSGKTVEAALETLAAYEARYRDAIAAAGVGPAPGAGAEVDIVARVEGDATTAFGAPGIIIDVDREPTDLAAGNRLAAIVVAAWGTFDRVAGAAPDQLTKGPRGGGRDTARIVEHVRSADDAYAAHLGIRPPLPLRASVLESLRTPSDGSPLHRRWTVRYAARRIAWHALDHAWEIEDRTP